MARQVTPFRRFNALLGWRRVGEEDSLAQARHSSERAHGRPTGGEEVAAGVDVHEPRRRAHDLVDRAAAEAAGVARKEMEGIGEDDVACVCGGADEFAGGFVKVRQQGQRPAGFNPVDARVALRRPPGQQRLGAGPERGLQVGVVGEWARPLKTTASCFVLTEYGTPSGELLQVEAANRQVGRFQVAGGSVWHRAGGVVDEAREPSGEIACTPAAAPIGAAGMAERFPQARPWSGTSPSADAGASRATTTSKTTAVPASKLSPILDTPCFHSHFSPCFKSKGGPNTGQFLQIRSIAVGAGALSGSGSSPAAPVGARKNLKSEGNGCSRRFFQRARCRWRRGRICRRRRSSRSSGNSSPQPR